MKRIFALLLFVLPACMSSQRVNKNTSAGGGIYNTDKWTKSVTTSAVFEGQYIRCSVVSGETYSLSTCGASWDVEMELRTQGGENQYLAFDDDGCGMAEGPALLIWKASFTGIVCVLLNAGDELSDDMRSSTITITRTNAPDDFALGSDQDAEGMTVVENIYPNPSENNFNIRINCLVEQQMVYRITDLSGRPVLLQYAHAAEGISTVQLYTSDLPRGLYLLDVQDKEGLSVHRQEISKL